MPDDAGSERRVLLVDAHEPRRWALTEDLQRAGYDVWPTCTPLGAIVRACEGPVGMLILGSPHGAADTADLLEYFAEADPSIRRVLLWEPGVPTWIDQDVLALAHVLLPVPWTESDLRSLARSCAARGRRTRTARR